MTYPGELRLFALESSREFGERVARTLGTPLSDHEERDFEDGEHKARPLESVRDRDVYVIQSLYSDPRQSVNDKLCRLLFFLGALRDAAAGRVTAVVPYLGYARKDRKTKARDPLTSRYVAALFEAVGTDRVVTLDVHNLAAYQNAFRCATEHLEAKGLFVDWLRGRFRDDEVVVVSPDAGGVKRVDRLRDAWRGAGGGTLPSAFMEKQRSEGVVSGKALVGEVRDKVAVILDDLVSSGTTLARAAAACRAKGARRVYAAVTHGLFVGDANAVLADPALDGLLVTDSIPPFRLDPGLLQGKVTVLPVADLFAQAIASLHRGDSVLELMED
ncbi:MAG: ribose-phosphate pyrophosphokinase [Pseudomonadota bacterium]|nr:ribose-phosphate pyrophosphokinase [Pseudomonadota bacterium]